MDPRSPGFADVHSIGRGWWVGVRKLGGDGTFAQRGARAMANGHDELGLVSPAMTAAGEPKRMNPTMPDPLVRLMLDTIYRDMQTPQSHRDALADWLLDTQARTAPLEIGVLLPYLATRQPDLLKQLKNNWRVRGELANALASIPLG